MLLDHLAGPMASIARNGVEKRRRSGSRFCFEGKIERRRRLKIREGKGNQALDELRRPREDTGENDELNGYYLLYF